MQDILAPALLRHFGQSTDAPGAPYPRLLGADYLSDVVFVDQSPIGKTARSNPVRYVGAWDSIRELLRTQAWPSSEATRIQNSASTTVTVVAQVVVVLVLSM
jgi:excinuclease UvrABC ATPase subunit